MKQTLQITLALSFHVAYMVLIPLFLFGGGGLLLDRHFGTSPLYIIAGFVLAFTLTILWMTRRLKEILKTNIVK